MYQYASRTPIWKKVLPYLLFLLIFGFVYWSFDWAIGAVIHQRKVVQVPNLQGRTVMEAVNLLKGVNLGLMKEGEQFEKQAPVGTIVFQNPPSGLNVREGRVVRVILSQGGETFYVPDVIGQPMRQGQTTLQNAGLGIGEVEKKPSLRYEKDEIITTDPPPGSTVKKNAFIHIVVSAGAPASGVLLVPDFVGQNVLEVKKWATSNQMQLTVREEEDEDSSLGDVLSQSPVLDSPMRPGDTLTVVVNKTKGTDGSMHVRYDVPSGGPDRDIKILLVTSSGSKEIYRKAHTAGSVVDVPVPTTARGKARVFANGILVKEVEVE